MRDRSTAATTSAVEREVTALVEALWDLGDDRLAGRLWRCQRGRLDKREGRIEGWPRMCRSVACPVCRRWLRRGWAEKVANRFSHVDNADCSHVTIVLDCVDDLSRMVDVVRYLRVAIRNLRDRYASVSRRWASVETYGMVEVDAHHAEDLVILPPQRREIVGALSSTGSGVIRWVPHTHLAVHHPDLDRYALRDALAIQWAGPVGRVDVRPFHADQTPSENAHAITSYATKYKMATTYAGWIEEEWPIEWQALYWSWLSSLRAGVAPLRVSMGPRTGRSALTLKVSAHDPFSEPMPVVF